MSACGSFPVPRVRHGLGGSRAQLGGFRSRRRALAAAGRSPGAGRADEYRLGMRAPLLSLAPHEVGLFLEPGTDAARAAILMTTSAP